MGAFTLSLFALLAAVYLTLEADEPELRDDFRVRALAAAAAVAIAGALAAALASAAAPELSARLTGTAVGRGVVAAGLLSLAGAAGSLLGRRFIAARALAALATLAVLAGWGWGLYPWIVVGAVDVHTGAAPDVTLRIVAWILAGGSLILGPAYAYLYAIFHRQVLFPRSQRRRFNSSS